MAGGRVMYDRCLNVTTHGLTPDTIVRDVVNDSSRTTTFSVGV